MKTKLLLLLSSFVCLNLFSQTYIVNDDFEADALGTLPDGWVIRYSGTGNANQKVVDNPVKNGIHSFQVSGASWAANLSKSVTDLPNEFTLEGWVRAENVATGGRCGLTIGNPSKFTWGAFLARVEFYNGNIITYYHTGNYGTQYVLQAATSSTWYHFKIEANSSAGTYKVYINGLEASSNTTGATISEFPFPNTITPTSIELYGNSMVYFDDVKLYETSSLVAHYPFNGNANDISGNNLHGVLNGPALTDDRFGNPDSAYSFDGNDIITINHNELLNSEEELSISVWIKPDLQQNAMILGKSNYTTSTNYLLRTKNTGYIQFEYKDFANSNNIPLNVNEWNHIAVVSNADNSKQIYINGNLASHTTSNSPYGLVNNDLTIGARSGAEFFRGAIDDLMIFKTALTETEVLSLFNNNSLDIKSNNPLVKNTFYYRDNTIYFNSDEKLTQIKELSIYNLMAQKVFKSNNLSNEINLNFLSQGIYIIRLESKNGTFETKKVFVK